MEDTLKSALIASGKILMKYFNKPVAIKQKESQSSIVTEADFVSNEVITGIIKERFPGHCMISEETGFTGSESEYTWIIDPLDGTSNFASGIPWFGILIALFKNNQPIMGGAYLPVQDTLYFAEKGKGAFRNNQPLKIDDSREMRDSIVAFSTDYTDDEAFLKKGLELFRFLIKSSRNIRSTNSLIDFIYVAEGKFGACINLFTRIWDISAFDLIIKEAGGLMKDIYGKDLNFPINQNITEQNFPVVAGTPKITGVLKNNWFPEP